MPILVARDRATGWYMASVVEKKGRRPHAAKRLEGMIEQLGYNRMGAEVGPGASHGRVKGSLEEDETGGTDSGGVASGRQ